MGLNTIFRLTMQKIALLQKAIRNGASREFISEAQFEKLDLL